MLRGGQIAPIPDADERLGVGRRRRLGARLEERLDEALLEIPPTAAEARHLEVGDHCVGRATPLTHWESVLELRILKGGFKLEVDFQTWHADDKPLLNAVRREYRKALDV